MCYRREDTAAYAGRLHESLVRAFGEEHIFMDIDSIQPGEDFDEALTHTLNRADAVLVLIGPHWSAPGSDGRRRIDDVDDYVRLEIATALQRGVPLIPVLLGGATIPKSDVLPEDLRKLTRRQSIEVSDTRWVYDTERLAEALRRIQPKVAGFDGTAGAPPTTPFSLRKTLSPGGRVGRIGAATAIVALCVAGAYSAWSGSRKQVPPAPAADLWQFDVHAVLPRLRLWQGTADEASVWWRRIDGWGYVRETATKLDVEFMQLELQADYPLRTLNALHFYVFQDSEAGHQLVLSRVNRTAFAEAPGSERPQAVFNAATLANRLPSEDGVSLRMSANRSFRICWTVEEITSQELLDPNGTAAKENCVDALLKPIIIGRAHESIDAPK